MHKVDYALAKLVALTSACSSSDGAMAVLFVATSSWRRTLSPPSAVSGQGAALHPGQPADRPGHGCHIAGHLVVLARRAYSAISLGAYFLVVESVTTIIFGSSSGRRGLGRQADTGGAGDLAHGRDILVLWSAAPDGLRLSGHDGPGAYLLSSLVSLVAFTAVLLLRYRRMAA